MKEPTRPPDGIIKPQVLKWIEGHESWIHYVGAQYGKQKLLYFKLASFQLIPGLVGLNIIDSFVTLTPLITTQNRLHSPEISYLVNYENGIMTKNSIADYCEAIIKLVNDLHLQERMIDGCRAAREEYTIENMASNFQHGIERILEITN